MVMPLATPVPDVVVVMVCPELVQLLSVELVALFKEKPEAFVVAELFIA